MMPGSDLPAPVCPWRTSSYSNGEGECVEVSASPTHVAIRDSKDRSGPVLLYPRADWLAFVGAGKSWGYGEARQLRSRNDADESVPLWREIHLGGRADRGG
jgi:hypothetical protein